MAYHGDFVKDVAFKVENLDYILEYARKQGAEVVRDLWEEKDEYGVVRMATLKTVSYKYVFLPLFLLCPTQRLSFIKLRPREKNI